MTTASANGFTVTEIGEAGVVELLAVSNPLPDCVLAASPEQEAEQAA